MTEHKPTLTARVTFLEMKDRPSMVVPRPSRPSLALMRANTIPTAFYRYLYEQVGRDYHWYLRRIMPDAELDAIINAQTTQIDVLYANGCPAGFFELDLSALPNSLELAYFGLCQDFVGLGIGKWFLWTAIDAAWDHNPDSVKVHTNTLDHPKALPLYQKLGFEPVGIGEEVVEPWPE